jgi:HSP20 family protein
MASAVASVEVPPKPVFLMDILASPSASGKTAASARHVFSTGGAPPRSSDDGVKDSTGKDAAADADRPRELDLSIPKLFTGGTYRLALAVPFPLFPPTWLAKRKRERERALMN